MPTRRQPRRPALRKANSPPARTVAACKRRAKDLRAGSPSAARLLRSHCPAPGAAQRKAAAVSARRRARAAALRSLTGAERDALRAAISAPGGKAKLYRRMAAGTLRGALASAAEKLGPGGFFALSATALG